jgi:hypothetical protein
MRSLAFLALLFLGGEAAAGDSFILRDESGRQVGTIERDWNSDSWVRRDRRGRFLGRVDPHELGFRGRGSFERFGDGFTTGQQRFTTDGFSSSPRVDRSFGDGFRHRGGGFGHQGGGFGHGGRR